MDGDAALQQPVDVFDEGSAAEWELDGSGKSADSGKQQQQQQQLEHVATVGGGTQVGGTGADAGGRVYSSCTIYAVRNGSGQLAKYYYKFANVRLTRKTLYFFMPPGAQPTRGGACLPGLLPQGCPSGLPQGCQPAACLRSVHASCVPLHHQTLRLPACLPPPAPPAPYRTHRRPPAHARCSLPVWPKYKSSVPHIPSFFFFFPSPPAPPPHLLPAGMHKPEELWVDFISGNATSPKLPTMVVIKGEVQRQKWFYLPVKYTQAPSNCAAWTNKPTYFLQVRYR